MVEKVGAYGDYRLRRKLNEIIDAVNATGDTSFGPPQHMDGKTITNQGGMFDFGPSYPAPPVTSLPAHRGYDIMAHWYNDFGLDDTILSSSGASTWYDWSWNFPTNTGDGNTTRGYDPQRVPLQGYYKGDDPDVLDWQAKWAAEAGITAVTMVEGSGGFSRTNGATDWSQPANKRHWMYQLFNNAKNFSALRYILWIQSANPGSQAALEAQHDEVVWAYQTYPNFYTYTQNGLTYPVVYLWDGGSLRTNLGSTENLAAHTSLAGKFQAMGYAGVAIMSPSPEWLTSFTGAIYTRKQIADAGILGMNVGYSSHHSDLVSGGYPSGEYSEYAEKVNFPAGLNSVPNVVTGRRSQNPVTNFYPGLRNPSPVHFKRALQRAVNHMVLNGSPRIISIGNMSEWAEQGPGLIPNMVDGFGYLDAVRSMPTAQAPQRRTISTTFTWDPPSIAAAGTASTTVTLTNARVINTSLVEVIPGTGTLAGCVVSAYVSANDTITVVLFNPTGAAINPTSAVWRVRVEV